MMVCGGGEDFGKDIREFVKKSTNYEEMIQ